MAALWGCAESTISPTASKSSTVTVEVTRKERDEIQKSEEKMCGITKVPLVTATGEIVGEVIVSNSDEELHVAAVCFDFWEISEAHMHFGRSLNDFPLNNPGNPQIGHFAYKNEGELTTGIDFKADLADVFDPVELAVAPEENALYVSFHANILQTTLREGDESEFEVVNYEGAWSRESSFDGRSWAMYFEHSVELCE